MTPRAFLFDKVPELCPQSLPFICGAWILIAVTSSSACSHVSSTDMAVRDGTISANADASLVEGTSNLVQGLERVEQDQIVALAVINKTPACEVRQQAAEVRAAWAKSFALVGVAKVLHERLKTALAAPSPDRALIQVCVTELNGVLVQLYGELEIGRKRIAEKKR